MAFLQLGDIADSSFSTRTAGVVNPTDAATLATFKDMQAQFNRLAQAGGFAKITVDGSIGSKTAILLSLIAGWLGQGGASVDPARNILIQSGGYAVADIARHADVLGHAAQGVADQMNVPPKISQPSGPSTIALPGGGTTKITTPTPAAAGLLDSLGQMDQTTMLLAAGAVGAVVYFSGKPKRTSSRRTRSTRRSRRFARRGSRR